MNWIGVRRSGDRIACCAEWPPWSGARVLPMMVTTHRKRVKVRYPLHVAPVGRIVGGSGGRDARQKPQLSSF
jgi:hypothetical protein